MRFRLALFTSALAATLAVGTAAASADGGFGDKAVADDVPTFRLNPYTLEPGCYLATGLADAHVDFGDTVKSAHIKVRPKADFSVDQALVPARTPGTSSTTRSTPGPALRTRTSIPIRPASTSRPGKTSSAPSTSRARSPVTWRCCARCRRANFPPAWPR